MPESGPGGVGIGRVPVCGNTYRFIPSHFPPLQLFEGLLNSDELDAAYALEALTNDRLLQQAGDISLVAKEERVVGPGTTPIMAAFTHIGIPSRFTSGAYGVYYAARDKITALRESSFSRARFLSATGEPAQTLSMRCYHCRVDARLADLRPVEAVHAPDSFAVGQALGARLRDEGEAGALYNSVRNPGGECVAIFKPTALRPPAEQAGHFQYYWDGNAVSSIVELRQWL